MDRSEVEQQVVRIVGEALRKEVEPRTRLLDSGGLVDSMNIVKLVSEIEDHFSVSFEDDLDLDYLDDVNSLIEAVWRRTNRGA